MIETVILHDIYIIQRSFIMNDLIFDISGYIVAKYGFKQM